MSLTRDRADDHEGSDLEVIPGCEDGQLVMCDPDHLGTRWLVVPEELVVEVEWR